MAQLCARHADRAFALVLDEAVNDRGLAMTSSFSNMLLAGQCVAHLDDISQFGEVVSQMSDAGKRFVTTAAETAARSYVAWMYPRLLCRFGSPASRRR